MPVRFGSNVGSVTHLVTVHDKLIFSTDASALYSSDEDGSNIKKLPMGRLEWLFGDRTGRLFVRLDGTRFAYSTDVGETWDTLMGPPGEETIGISGDTRNLYVCSRTGIYISADTGKYWQRVLNGVKTGAYYNIVTGRDGYVWCNGFGSENLLAGSFDYGAHWFIISSAPDFHGNLTVTPTDELFGPGYYMHGTVAQSTQVGGGRLACDSGSNILVIKDGFPNLQIAERRDLTPRSIFNPLASPVNLQSNGRLIASFAGKLYTLDAATHWQPYGYANANVDRAAINRFDHSLLAAQSGLSQSFDTGRSWKNILGSLPAGTVQTTAAPGNRIYAATRGVFYTDDSGKTWYETSDHRLTGSVITSLASDSDNTVYSSTSTSVFRTADRGAVWLPITELHGSQVGSLITNGHGGVAASLGHDSVAVSTNFGSSWKAFSLSTGTRPDAMILNQENALFACSNRTVLYVAPGSISPLRLDDGIDLNETTSLGCDGNNVVYLATKGRGVMQGTGELPVISVAESRVVSTPSMYPNPADKFVRLDESTGATYRLISINGGVAAAGVVGADQTISTDHVPNGWYLLQLSTGSTRSETTLLIRHR
jgi:photosystem II stability/assembly factor-like uncharacterized protein